MKRWIFVICAMMMVPALACGEAYTIGEVREQVGKLGRWTQTYTDDYGREVAVDVAPIVPEAEKAPVLKIEKTAYTEENVYHVCEPSTTQVTEESFGKVLNAYDPATGDKTEVRLFDNSGITGVWIEYESERTKVESDPAKRETESFNGDYYLSNEVEWTRAYLDGYDLTVQDCVKMANERLGAFFPECNLDLELVWVGVVPNSRPCYVCTLRPRLRGIPVLLDAGDTVFGVSEDDAGFRRPDSWRQHEALLRWGDFAGPSWCCFAYADGGYQMEFAPFREAGLIENDVPLCGVDKVIQSVEARIRKGNIREVHALRFGYCCYINEKSESVVYPVWEVECDYYYKPKEKTKDYEELEEVPITNRLMYRTMIVNAQTGEFMDPLELKERLLDCPEIITWEDVQ